jgi:hypothetical protein
MGDRFYAQQKAHKPGRRLKKHAIEELEQLIGPINGLDRATIATIDALTEAVEKKLLS